MKNLMIGIKLMGLYFCFQAILNLAFIAKYAFVWDGALVDIKSEMITNFIFPIVMNFIFSLFLLNKTKWIAELIGKEIKEIENS
jgi:hypothetical protein